MRLDKFLKVSRLIKRRTEAKKACKRRTEAKKACLAKCIRINNRIAKAGDEVKIGDEIEINFANKILQTKVLNVPLKNVPAEKASSLYEVIRETKKETD